MAKASHFRFGPAGAWFLTAPLLAISLNSHGVEPVFNVQEHSIPDTLKPEALPLSFYTFEPQEYWAEPNDSYWMGFSNFILRQERLQSPKVQSFGQWADRTLSGEVRNLPHNDSYLRLGFATESEYGDPAQFKPEVRFRLDVPTTKRKLRLFVAAQIFSTYKRLNNRSTVSPRIGVIGESQPGWRTTSAFIDLTWRYRLYSNWLFAELIPALTFPREKAFKDQGSVVFRVEMFFSGSINPDF